MFKRYTIFGKICASALAFVFTFSSVYSPDLVHAQTFQFHLSLPQVTSNPTANSHFITLKGLNIHPDNPLRFDFIIDHGERQLPETTERSESLKLVKYFLASLTIPEEEMWVNLSPYEQNRIVPGEFGKTEMGRDLLAQDYMLKQLAASLMSPDKKVGAEFWKRMQVNVGDENQIAMNVLSKIWVVPESAQIYEHKRGAFVVDSHLKVMMEEGETQALRDTLIPAIEYEVNNGPIFANLRQVYNAVILASWYKKALKESLISKVYVDKHKTSGVEHSVGARHAVPVQGQDLSIQKIYDKYIEAFKQGAYDMIKDEYDPTTQDVIPRKYFTGGASFAMTPDRTNISQFNKALDAAMGVKGDIITVDLKAPDPSNTLGASAAMSAHSTAGGIGQYDLGEPLNEADWEDVYDVEKLRERTLPLRVLKETQYSVTPQGVFDLATYVSPIIRQEMSEFFFKEVLNDLKRRMARLSAEIGEYGLEFQDKLSENMEPWIVESTSEEDVIIRLASEDKKHEFVIAIGKFEDQDRLGIVVAQRVARPAIGVAYSAELNIQKLIPLVVEDVSENLKRSQLDGVQGVSLMREPVELPNAAMAQPKKTERSAGITHDVVLVGDSNIPSADGDQLIKDVFNEDVHRRLQGELQGIFSEHWHNWQVEDERFITEENYRQMEWFVWGSYEGVAFEILIEVTMSREDPGSLWELRALFGLNELTIRDRFSRFSQEEISELQQRVQSIFVEALDPYFDSATEILFIDKDKEFIKGLIEKSFPIGPITIAFEPTGQTLNQGNVLPAQVLALLGPSEEGYTPKILLDKLEANPNSKGVLLEAEIKDSQINGDLTKLIFSDPEAPHRILVDFQQSTAAENWRVLPENQKSVLAWSARYKQSDVHVFLTHYPAAGHRSSHPLVHLVIYITGEEELSEDEVNSLHQGVVNGLTNALIEDTGFNEVFKEIRTDFDFSSAMTADKTILIGEERMIDEQHQRLISQTSLMEMNPGPGVVTINRVFAPQPDATGHYPSIADVYLYNNQGIYEAEVKVGQRSFPAYPTGSGFRIPFDYGGGSQSEFKLINRLGKYVLDGPFELALGVRSEADFTTINGRVAFFTNDHVLRPGQSMAFPLDGEVDLDVVGTEIRNGYIWETGPFAQIDVEGLDSNRYDFRIRVGGMDYTESGDVYEIAAGRGRRIDYGRLDGEVEVVVHEGRKGKWVFIYNGSTKVEDNFIIRQNFERVLGDSLYQKGDAKKFKFKSGETRKIRVDLAGSNVLWSVEATITYEGDGVWTREFDDDSNSLDSEMLERLDNGFRYKPSKSAQASVLLYADGELIITQEAKESVSYEVSKRAGSAAMMSGAKGIVIITVLTLSAIAALVQSFMEEGDIDPHTMAPAHSQQKSSEDTIENVIRRLDAKLKTEDEERLMPRYKLRWYMQELKKPGSYKDKKNLENQFDNEIKELREKNKSPRERQDGDVSGPERYSDVDRKARVIANAAMAAPTMVLVDNEAVHGSQLGQNLTYEDLDYTIRLYRALRGLTLKQLVIDINEGLESDEKPFTLERLRNLAKNENSEWPLSLRWQLKKTIRKLYKHLLRLVVETLEIDNSFDIHIRYYAISLALEYSATRIYALKNNPRSAIHKDDLKRLYDFYQKTPDQMIEVLKSVQKQATAASISAAAAMIADDIETSDAAMSGSNKQHFDPKGLTRAFPPKRSRTGATTTYPLALPDAEKKRDNVVAELVVEKNKGKKKTFLTINFLAHKETYKASLSGLKDLAWHAALEILADPSRSTKSSPAMARVSLRKIIDQWNVAERNGLFELNGSNTFQSPPFIKEDADLMRQALISKAFADYVEIMLGSRRGYGFDIHDDTIVWRGISMQFNVQDRLIIRVDDNSGYFLIALNKALADILLTLDKTRSTETLIKPLRGGRRIQVENSAMTAALEEVPEDAAMARRVAPKLKSEDLLYTIILYETLEQVDRADLLEVLNEGLQNGQQYVFSTLLEWAQADELPDRPHLKFQLRKAMHFLYKILYDLVMTEIDEMSGQLLGKVLYPENAQSGQKISRLQNDVNSHIEKKDLKLLYDFYRKNEERDARIEEGKKLLEGKNKEVTTAKSEDKAMAQAKPRGEVSVSMDEFQGWVEKFSEEEGTRITGIRQQAGDAVLDGQWIDFTLISGEEEKFARIPYYTHEEKTLVIKSFENKIIKRTRLLPMMVLYLIFQLKNVEQIGFFDSESPLTNHMIEIMKNIGILEGEGAEQGQLKVWKVNREFVDRVGGSEELLRKFIKKETLDFAMSANKGGIDMNAAMIDMDVQREAGGFQMPEIPAEFLERDFQGFTPVIINIQPIVNLPLLLGMIDEPVEENPVDFGQELEPVDKRRVLEQALL